ncbi:hypothetical protein MMC34_003020 [Xylographa carneopallida]|nr:hypothetical protein [Xylographa carneopallida]
MLSHVTAAITLTSLIVTVSSQVVTTNFSSSLVQQIIGETSLTTLNAWCTAQHTECGTLCNGATDSNSCTGSSLSYNCTCTSNHSGPALQYYANTIPFFLCNTGKGDCMAANANDLAAQQQCNQTYVCGNSTYNAATAMTTSSSSSVSATSTPSGTAAGAGSGSSTASGSAASPSATKAAAALTIGQDYGVGILVAGLLAGMGFLL